MLTHLLKEAKRHQRFIVVVLLDLRNAFGEVNHKLISKSLVYHHVPQPIIDFIENIYKQASINVSLPHLNTATSAIHVNRGVLQGDPSSPLLFNICYNSFLKVIDEEKYKQLGFAWGSKVSSHITSCLQFADDTCLIDHDCDSVQRLVNIAQAWTNYAKLPIHIDIRQVCNLWHV